MELESDLSCKISDQSITKSACSSLPPPTSSVPSTKNEASKPFSKRCLVAELSCLFVVMTVIWVTIALPVVFFYIPVGSINFTTASDDCTNASCGSGQEMSLQDKGGDDLMESGPLNCSNHFFLTEVANTSFCVPECPSWMQYEAHASTVFDVLVLVWACVGVVSACGVLIISCIRYKHIFVYPSIFVVYLTATVLFLGMVFYYCIIQITLWWFFHVSALFWIFKFPLHFRRYRKLKRVRYIHMTCVALALVLPALPIIASMGDYATDVRAANAQGVELARGLGFGLTNFPPIFCSGIDAVTTFYSLILPATIVTEVGLTMLVLTFWDIRKMHLYRFQTTRHRNGGSRSKKQQHLHIGAGEKKILIVLIYYVLLLEFSLMAFTLATRNVHLFRHAVKVNFACESRGYNPDSPCDRSELEALKYPGVSLVAYLFLELFPVINFIYVINFRKVKKWICGYFMKKPDNSNTTDLTSSYSRQNSLTYLKSISIDIPEIIQEVEPPVGVDYTAKAS